MIDAFLSGENRSKQRVQEIEGLVLQFFSDEEWFDNLSLALAQYAPGEGRNYLGEEDLAAELAWVGQELRGESSGPP